MSLIQWFKYVGDMPRDEPKDIRSAPHRRLRPGDLALYKGSYSMLAKEYEPKAQIVDKPVGSVKKDDLVMVLAVMPTEIFVINQRSQIGWVVTTFFERVK